VEVLEPLVHLERDRDARVDVVPAVVEHPAEVHRVVALDERGGAKLGEEIGTLVRAIDVGGGPPHVTLDGPATAISREGEL